MLLAARLIVVILCIMAALPATAQSHTKLQLQPTIITTQVKPDVSDDGKEVVEPFNGTFQFIFTKGIKQFFADEIFKTIDQNRKEDEEVTVTLSSYCKVHILSRKQITSVQFKPFARSYIFEN